VKKERLKLLKAEADRRTNRLLDVTASQKTAIQSLRAENGRIKADLERSRELLQSGYFRNKLYATCEKYPVLINHLTYRPMPSQFHLRRD
jgi:ADP-heptose:LPS heptosyltransferase